MTTTLFGFRLDWTGHHQIYIRDSTENQDLFYISNSVDCRALLCESEGKQKSQYPVSYLILAYLHFSDEGPQLADNFAQCPGILLPVDAQVVRQTCCIYNKRKLVTQCCNQRGETVKQIHSTMM